MVVKGSNRKKFWHDAFFVFGIIGMLVAIYAVAFLVSGSLIQREIFLVAVAVLLIVAFAEKQKILEAAESLILIGIILALFAVSESISIAVMSFSIVILVAYLFLIGHYKKEPIGLIGSVGFILLALGYAVNTGNTKLLTSFFFAFGSISAMIYSLLALTIYKVRVQAIWMILNLLFALSPLLFFISAI